MLQRLLPNDTQTMRGLRDLEEDHGQATKNVERRGQGTKRQDNGQAALERENNRLKRIVAEKELELEISRKVRRL